MSKQTTPTAFGALLRRDFLLAYRRRAELLQPLLFLLVVVTLFPLGVGPSPQLLASIAPGVIWIAALLASVLSLDSLFRSDFEDGTLEQMVLSGQSLALIALARIVAHWLPLLRRPLPTTCSRLRFRKYQTHQKLRGPHICRESAPCLASPRDCDQH